MSYYSKSDTVLLGWVLIIHNWRGWKWDILKANWKLKGNLKQLFSQFHLDFMLLSVRILLRQWSGDNDRDRMLLQTPSTTLCSELLLHVHIHITIFRKARKPFSMYQYKCNAVTAYGYVRIILDTYVSVGRLILHGFRVTVFMNAFVGIDAAQCVCVCSPHVFQSISLQIHWKLCVFCLLCEAYLRWSLLHGSEQSSDPADIIRYTKEWEFYGMFALAALGKMTTASLLIKIHFCNAKLL